MPIEPPRSCPDNPLVDPQNIAVVVPCLLCSSVDIGCKMKMSKLIQVIGSMTNIELHFVGGGV